MLKLILVCLIFCSVFPAVLGFNLPTWNVEPQSGELPTPRSSAGLAKIKHELILFGGHEQCPDDSFCVIQFFNDIHKYNFQTNSWSEPIITSVSRPGIRTFFPYVTDVDSMIIYGGLNYSLPNVNVYGDLWRFFPSTNSWVELAQYNTGPGQRAGAGMVLFDNKLYIGFGIDQTL